MDDRQDARPAARQAIGIAMFTMARTPLAIR
jgi:hypothetical protein